MLVPETRIGKIRAVNGAKVFVAMEPNSLVAPIIHGRIHHVTQIGTILKVKIGANYVLGHVMSATAASSSQTMLQETNDDFGWSIAPGEKALILNLFGEIKSGKFERGLTTFPDIDSDVHVITINDLHLIYSSKEACAPLVFGTISGGLDLPAILDLQKFVMRHGAIVGATGTGKSNAVSTILSEIIKGKWPGSKIIIIDIHGEYSSWLKEKANVFSIGGKNPLRIPYWLIPFEEQLAFFTGRQVLQEDLGIRNLKDAILQAKIEWIKAKRYDKLVNVVTADSPIPFDLRKIWLDFFVKEFATYTTKERDVIDWPESGRGNKDKMIPPSFKPPGTGSAAPFNRLPGLGTGTASILEKIRTRCLDRNYSFLFGSSGDEVLKIDLDQLVKEWVEGPNITVLDLNGIPSDVVDVSVGALSRLFFDLWRWGRSEKGVGKNRPIYLVFDEAHLYLSDSKYGFNTGSAIRGVTRILREGRKYGVGSLIVSQRPSDINPTIFSQIGTIISLRLNNSSDLSIVKGSLSDNLSNISEIIPSLRTGEALISGEATPLPLRARFREIKDRKHGADASIIGTWNVSPSVEGIKKAIELWRSRGN